MSSPKSKIPIFGKKSTKSAYAKPTSIKCGEASATHVNENSFSFYKATFIQKKKLVKDLKKSEENMNSVEKITFQNSSTPPCYQAKAKNSKASSISKYSTGNVKTPSDTNIPCAEPASSIPEYPRLGLDSVAPSNSKACNKKDYNSLKESINTFKQKFTSNASFLHGSSSDTLGSPRLLSRKHSDITNSSAVSMDCIQNLPTYGLVINEQNRPLTLKYSEKKSTNDNEQNNGLKNESQASGQNLVTKQPETIIIPRKFNSATAVFSLRKSKPQQRLKLLYKYYKENRTQLVLSACLVFLNTDMERMLNLTGVRLHSSGQPNKKPLNQPMDKSNTTSSSTLERINKKNSNNNLVINVRNTKAFDNQETIIEECKNSLNELIKASKWPEKVKMMSKENQSDLDTIHLEQLPDMDMSQSSIATSSMSLNCSNPVDHNNTESTAYTATKQMGRPVLNMLTQPQPANTDLVFKNKLFDVKQHKQVVKSNNRPGLSNLITSPISSTMLLNPEQQQQNNTNFKSDFIRNRYDNYDNYNEFSKSNTTLAYKEPEISSPASNLVGGASQFNSKFFQLKKSQSVANGQLCSLNLIINNDIASTEDLNQDPEQPAEQGLHEPTLTYETKKPSFIKNKSSIPINNSYTKFASSSRSTSANNLKYPNYSNIQSNSTSASQLNHLEDAHLLSPVASSLSSSNSFISSLSSSVKSLLNSPDSLSNRLFHPVDQTTRQSCSGSARLINKKKAKSSANANNNSSACKKYSLISEDGNKDAEEIKRFSTHSEILTATSNTLDQAEHTKTLPPPSRSSYNKNLQHQNTLSNHDKLQRRSTPVAGTQNHTDSLISIASACTSNVSAPVTNMLGNSKPSCLSSTDNNNNMIRSKSRKSLSKLDTVKNQFIEEDIEPSSGFTERKQNNSWLAQSFKKAFQFGNKMDTKKKLTNSHKSQYQINQQQPQNRNKLTSSISVHNCAMVASSSSSPGNHGNGIDFYQSVTKRNSCGESNSKQSSSMSDDEEKETNSMASHNRPVKLSLLPVDDMANNDSDSDYEDSLNKKYQANNSSLMTKRSYRSESELANKLQLASSQNYMSPESCVSSHVTNKKPSQVKNASNGHQSSYLKLSKTHKSVSSLLTTSNANNNHQSNVELYQNHMSNKLQEINQMYNQQKTNIQRPQTDGSKLSLIANERAKKCNCKINETIITDLKKKLTLAENKLTDIRLEALSSVHQVDQLKDYLDKMKSEMLFLKSENKMLKKHIQEKQSLNINGIPQSQGTISELDEHYLNDGTESMAKMNQVFQALNNNLNTYYYSYNFLLGDENESLLRKALVTVECSYQLKPDNRLDSPSYNINNRSQITQSLQDSEFFAYEICTINVDSKLKWDLMDGIISYVFKRYINKIDPSQSMGLTKNSIDKYYIGEIVRKINDKSSYPDMLPFGYLIGKTCAIRIVLKDNYQNLDSLAYETLIPRYLLEDYVSLLENHRLIGINSAHKFGKTFLMRKLGQFISKNNNKEIEMIYFNMEEIVSSTANENVIDLTKTLLVNIEMRLRALDGDKTAMILLDNYHVLFDSEHVPLEVVHSILRLINRNRLYLIVTTQEKDDNTMLQEQQEVSETSNNNSSQRVFEFNQAFKWINLNINQGNFLHLYLNRNLIHYQVEQYKQKEACIIMEKVVAFVIDAFKVTMDFMNKLGNTENSSSHLVYFMGLPFNVEQSERWFIELWNYSIIPQINDVIKMKLTKNDKHRMNLKQFDPTDWILNNYAWPKNEVTMNIQQRLLRIRFFGSNNSNDITTFNRISSSSDDSSEFNTNSMSDTKNQNLISMLLRLKKATYKEETSSGCFDSNSSNSSEVSPKSNSPTMSHSNSTNMNFKETSEFFNSLKIKNKIESAL